MKRLKRLQTAVRAAGTYTTSGSSLNEAPAGGGAPASDDYCVEGGRLHVLTRDAAMAIVSDVVGRKKL